MGQEEEKELRRKAFAGFAVDDDPDGTRRRRSGRHALPACAQGRGDHVVGYGRAAEPGLVARRRTAFRRCGACSRGCSRGRAGRHLRGSQVMFGKTQRQHRIGVLLEHNAV